MPDLPTGTVTFLFTDIEGSTRLLAQLGDERYAHVLAEQQDLLRAAFSAAGGREVDTQGDAFFVAFSRAKDAIAAAIAAQGSVLNTPWPSGSLVRVRMGLHTGEPVARTSAYVGMDVHRAARICAAAHGGQILLSHATRELVGDHLPEGVTLRDLGLHRLKDLAAPQRLFQVVTPGLPDAFPPLRSLDTLPNNLPRQLTRFIGRRRELADIKVLLSRTSLLTLTGVGGCGKTRLALQAAADLLDQHSDGIWLVELAPISVAEVVPQAIASTMGIREEAGRPIMASLIAALERKQMLLVLDNCEHLLPACAELAPALLHRCAHLRILATSREGLGTTGEVTYRVPPLSVSAPDRVRSVESTAEQEAVQLFVDRAQAALPSFTLTPQTAEPVARICHRLDGVPLAIELAAARVKALSVEQLAARLDDRFRLLTGGSRTALPRQQTLRAVMDWSYNLLSQTERILLQRLSVFAGSCRLESAEAICAGGGINGADVFDLLAHLVEKSLVLAEPSDGEMRYCLLETIRQYAKEKLLESGETAAVRNRHASWYVSFAEAAAPELRGPEQAGWIRRLDSEFDNLRTALEWSREQQEGGRLLQLATALWRFWNVRGYLREGRDWLEGGLAAAPGAPDRLRANALFGLGILIRERELNPRIDAIFAESLRLFRQVGDSRMIAEVLRWTAIVAADRGELDRARTFAKESLALFQQLRDKPGISTIYRLLGYQALMQDAFNDAWAPLMESLKLGRELGDKRGIASSLQMLSYTARRQGLIGRAEELIDEALGAEEEVGDRLGLADARHTQANLARHRGDYIRASSLLEQSLELRKQSEHKERMAYTLGTMGLVALERGDLGQARTLLTEAVALAREVDSAQVIVETLNGLALLSLHEGDTVRSRALLEECLTLVRERKLPRGWLADTLDGLGRVATRRGEFELAGPALREALQHRREMGARLDMIRSLDSMACLAYAQGYPDRAVRLLAAAAQARHEFGIIVPPVEQPQYDAMEAGVLGAIGEEQYQRARTMGWQMTLEDAVAYALEADDQ